MFKIERTGVETHIERIISFDDIAKIVKKLPRSKKIKLSREIEKETLDSTLSRLLSSFKTNRLNQKDIDAEAEIVRTQLYAKRK